MRHFQGTDSNVAVKTTSSLCHQVVQERWNFALFTYQCCHPDAKGLTAECNINEGNVWLNTIDALLLTVRVLALLTIGVSITSSVVKVGHVSVPYVVKRDIPLIVAVKNLKVRKTERVSIKTQMLNDQKHSTVAIGNEEMKCKLGIDIRKEHGFARYKEFLKRHKEIEGKLIKISMERIHIVVDYDRLQGENDIPVGFFRSISHAVFSCGMKDTEPFKDCCQTKLFKLCSTRSSSKWITVFGPLAKLLLVIIIPLVFYIRIIFYYVFEHDEVTYRHGRAQLAGLTMSPNKFNLIDYVKPTDPLFIVIYMLYLSTAVLLGYLVFTGDKKKFTNIVTTSFMDLRSTHSLEIFKHFIKSMTVPFTRCGVVGCCVFPVYCILVVPFLILAYLFYLVPLIYFTARLLTNSTKVLCEQKEKSNDKSCATKLSERSPFCNESINLLPHYRVREMRARQNITIDNVAKHEKAVEASSFRQFLRFLVVVMMILTMFGLSLLAAECVGFLAEIATFTLMGIMINAGVYLKFVSLILLIMVYSHSCFSGVHKKYLKLNKSLFGQVKGMLNSEITQVTSQKAEDQENTAFKGETVSDHLARAEKAKKKEGKDEKAKEDTKEAEDQSQETIKATETKREKTEDLDIDNYLGANKDNIQKGTVSSKGPQGKAEDPMNHGDIELSMIKNEEESVCLLPKSEQEVGIENESKPVDLEAEEKREAADDMVVPERHWRLSDVIFFIDRNDVPRMPKALFEQVCNIHVDGSPGPVHLSMLSSLKKFLSIVLFLAFVFVLTSSFGAIYNISSTNQMLATLVGGLIPMLMRTFMTPAEDSMELNTVSFQGKLNEILRDLEQKWPIHDLEVAEVVDGSEEGKEGMEIGEDNPELDLVIISEERQWLSPMGEEDGIGEEV